MTAFLTGGRLADVAGHFRDAFARYTSPAGVHHAMSASRCKCRDAAVHKSSGYYGSTALVEVLLPGRAPS